MPCRGLRPLQRYSCRVPRLQSWFPSYWRTGRGGRWRRCRQLARPACGPGRRRAWLIKGVRSPIPMSSDDGLTRAFAGRSRSVRRPSRRCCASSIAGAGGACVDTPASMGMRSSRTCPIRLSRRLLDGDTGYRLVGPDAGSSVRSRCLARLSYRACAPVRSANGAHCVPSPRSRCGRSGHGSGRPRRSDPSASRAPQASSATARSWARRSRSWGRPPP